MNITLDSCGEIVINNFSDAFKIYATGHNLGCDHDPGFSSTHSTNRIFAFLLCHPCVKVIYPQNPIENELVSKRGCPSLCRSEYQNRWVVWSGKECQKARQFGWVVSNISKNLLYKREWSIST